MRLFSLEPKAIILDFDGVILESAEVKTRAFRALFAAYPEQVERIVAYHVANAGISRFEKFKVVHGDFLGLPIDDATLRRLGERYSRLVFDEVVACPFVPGAHEFLRANAGRRKLFIASGTPEQEMRDIVARRGLAPFFRGVFGSPRTKAQIIGDICAEHLLRPADVLFIGDAMADYDGARTSGVPFIGRVPKGASNPFPPEGTIAIVEDFLALDAAWPSLVQVAT